ncbi:MAG: hypothetical protein IKK63_00305 [Clostridia bacterium]|nr:hypothetical protein [Clostridia bacterium]
MIAVKIFGCIVFGYYLEDACDGHVIITFPNKDYAEINTPAFMRKSIVNSLYRVKSYIHYENDDDTHYVRADSLEQIMMLELRSLASFLAEDEQAFADILEAKTNKSILNQQKFLETSIDKAKRGKRSP